MPTSQEERSIIFLRPEERPYGVEVRFNARTSGALSDIQAVCVPLLPGTFFTMRQGGKAQHESRREIVITIEGFSTVPAAQAAGRRLVQSLLWMAVKLGFALRLEYSKDEPYAIFDRTRTQSLTIPVHLEICSPASTHFGEIQNAYDNLRELEPKLLLSMEIFAAARLESSQRAVFLSVISALEPLANPGNLGQEVSSFVDACVRELESRQGIPTELKDSLRGRLSELRRESIRQALRRLARERLPGNQEAEQIVDKAYSLRSQVVHTGSVDMDVDLAHETRVVSALIREIYINILGQKFTHQSRV